MVARRQIEPKKDIFGDHLSLAHHEQPPSTFNKHIYRADSDMESNDNIYIWMKREGGDENDKDLDLFSRRSRWIIKV